MRTNKGYLVRPCYSMGVNQHHLSFGERLKAGRRVKKRQNFRYAMIGWTLLAWGSGRQVGDNNQECCHLLIKSWSFEVDCCRGYCLAFLTFAVDSNLTSCKSDKRLASWAGSFPGKVVIGCWSDVYGLVIVICIFSLLV